MPDPFFIANRGNEPKLVQSADGSETSLSFSVDSLDDIRAYVDRAVQRVLVSGRGLYVWNPASTATDDGSSSSAAVRPTNVAVSDPGRYEFSSLGVSGGGGGSSLSFDTPSSLRATASSTFTDRQTVSIATPPASWIYSTGTGANFADDGQTVIKPNDVLLASNGRFYAVTSSPVVPNLAGLRGAVSGKHSSIHVQARATLGDVGGGIFDLDSADLSSTDDDGTVIVVGSLRYKRRLSGEYRSEWWGLDNTGSASIDSTFNTKILPTIAARPLPFTFGKGIFKVDGSTSIYTYGLTLQSNLHVRGSGESATVILSNALHPFAGFTINNVTISDLTIQNNLATPFRGAIFIGPNPTNAPGVGGRSSNIRVERCSIKNPMAVQGLDGNFFSQGWTAIVCYFADNVWFDSNYVERAQLRFSGTRGLSIRGNRLFNSYATAMSIVSQTGFSAILTTEDDQLYDIVIDGNTIDSPQQGGIYVGNDAGAPAAGSLKRVTITNNNIRGAGALAGIYCRAGVDTDAVTIAHNHVDGLTKPFVVNSVVYGGSDATLSIPKHGRATGDQLYLKNVAGFTPTTLYTVASVSTVDPDILTITGVFTGPYTSGGEAIFASAGKGIYTFDVDDGTGSTTKLTIDGNTLVNLLNIGIWANYAHAVDVSICGNKVSDATDTGIRVQIQKQGAGTVGNFVGLMVANNIVRQIDGRSITIESGAPGPNPGGDVRAMDVHDNIILDPKSLNAGISILTFQGLIDGRVHHNMILSTATVFDGGSAGSSLLEYGIKEDTQGHIGNIHVVYDHNDIRGFRTADILLGTGSTSHVEFIAENQTQTKLGVTLGDNDQTVNPASEQVGEYRANAGLYTANRNLHFGTTGTGASVDGLEIAVTRYDTTAHTLAVINDGTGGGTMFTFPSAGPPLRAWFKWNNAGTAWVFSRITYIATEQIR